MASQASCRTKRTVVEDVLGRGARALGELVVAVKREQVLPLFEQGCELVETRRNRGLKGLLLLRHGGGSRGVVVGGGVVLVEATSEF